MLECRSIVKTYSKGATEEIKVLSDINLKIDLGEIVALKGSSGTGKTTLLNLISGLDYPSSGDIVFRNKIITNHNTSQLSLFRRNHIGIVFQFFNLINDLGEQNNLASNHPAIVARLSARMEEVDQEIEENARIPWQKN